jgi:hypothetical protein
MNKLKSKTRDDALVERWREKSGDLGNDGEIYVEIYSLTFHVELSLVRDPRARNSNYTVLHLTLTEGQNVHPHSLGWYGKAFPSTKRGIVVFVVGRNATARSHSSMKSRGLQVCGRGP